MFRSTRHPSYPCATVHDVASWRYSLALCLLVGGIAAAGLAHAAAPADDDNRFEQFLTRLGLVELQTLHEERQLDSASNDEDRKRIAARLADSYASELIASASDKPKYDGILARIQKLTAKVPSASTPALEVMLLQADYQRAEQLVSGSQPPGAAAASRKEAAAILERIAAPLEQRRKDLNAVLERLQAEIDKLPDGDARETASAEYARMLAVAGRATYFSAWSNYYAARLAPAAEARPRLEKAAELFRGILALDADYSEVQADGLGLDSVWRARALVGLGLCEAGLGNAKGCTKCFDLLEHSGVSPEIRELVPYFRFESLIVSRQYDAAVQFAQQRVASFTGGATQGKVSFCVSLVRAAHGDPPVPAPQSQELVKLGLTGLSKLRQTQIVRELLEQYSIDPSVAGGFYLRWAKSQGLFEKAERTRSPEDYQAALKELSATLADDQAKQDVGSAAQCRFLAAWCSYRLNNLEAAARNFEQSVAGLQAAKQETAVQAAWMAFVSYAGLAKKQPRFNASAIAALDVVKREFPEHEYAKRADYYLGKLQSQSLSPEESLARLEATAPDSPNYLNARNDIVLTLHRKWNEASGDAKSQLANQTLAAVDKYLAAAAKEADAARKVKACLIGADVAAQLGDATRVRGYLDKAAPLVKSLPDKSVAAAEYHYRRLQEAGASGDSKRRKEHADWLAASAAGTPYEMPGLVAASRSAEAAWKSASGSDKAASEAEVVRLYRRLGELLGSSPEVLQRDKNAQVVQSKLASFAFDAGRFDEAAQHLDRLTAAFPNNKDYLRRAGLASFKAGRYEPSLNAWRTLLAGLDKNTDSWFEAKYYQLACLFRSDAAKARPVWEQFKLLYPDMGPPKWRERFQEFERKG